MSIDPRFFPGYTVLPLRDSDADLAKWRAVIAAGFHFDGINDFAAPDPGRLNKTINATIRYTAEAVDEWQAPQRTWEVRTGDCEDLAILKYAILRHHGVNEADLALVLGHLTTPIRQGHAFLTCAGKVLDVMFDQIIEIADYPNFEPAKYLSGNDGSLLARQIVIGRR
jgi:hypothetical protein